MLSFLSERLWDVGGSGSRFLGQHSKLIGCDLMAKVIFPSCQLRWLGIRIGPETIIGPLYSGDPALHVVVRREIPWKTAFGV